MGLSTDKKVKVTGRSVEGDLEKKLRDSVFAASARGNVPEILIMRELDYYDLVNNIVPTSYAKGIKASSGRIIYYFGYRLRVILSMDLEENEIIVK